MVWRSWSLRRMSWCTPPGCRHWSSQTCKMPGVTRIQWDSDGVVGWCKKVTPVLTIKTCCMRLQPNVIQWRLKPNDHLRKNLKLLAAQNASSIYLFISLHVCLSYITNPHGPISSAISILLLRHRQQNDAVTQQSGSDIWHGSQASTKQASEKHLIFACVSLFSSFSIVIDGERGNRPRIYSLEQLLQEAVSSLCATNK